MNVSPSLAWLFWTAAGLAVLAALSLATGLTLLFSTVSHRRVALPLIWVSAAGLVACVIAIILVLSSA